MYLSENPFWPVSLAPGLRAKRARGRADRARARSEASPKQFSDRLYAEPPRLDEAGPVAFLATQEDIAAAYLFDSLAHGRVSPRSDINRDLFTKIKEVGLGDRRRARRILKQPLGDFAAFAGAVVAYFGRE